ncbi:hypothetical protein V1522DRAFT_395605 [Lipomyces starkeyi]
MELEDQDTRRQDLSWTNPRAGHDTISPGFADIAYRIAYIVQNTIRYRQMGDTGGGQCGDQSNTRKLSVFLHQIHPKSNRSLRSPDTSQEPDNLLPRLRREVDYYLLNDGNDEESEPEDRIPKVPRLDSQSTIDGSVDDDVAGVDVLPEESASQVLEDTSVADTTSETSKTSRARPATEWLCHRTTRKAIHQ